MATVFEVSVLAINNGKEHNNIYHVFDGNDNAPPFDIAIYFRDQLVIPMKAITTNLMTTYQVRVKSLTALNPNDITLIMIETGLSLSDPMPTGVHMFVKLNSLDTTFRSGGKLIGGGVDNQFVLGEPTAVYMDAMQAIFNLFFANMDTAIGCLPAIYRPSLSVPGVPVVGIVSDALVRGNSTNNRRRKPFER